VPILSTFILNYANRRILAFRSFFEDESEAESHFCAKKDVTHDYKCNFWQKL